MNLQMRFHWCAQRAQRNGGWHLADGMMTLTGDPFDPGLYDVVSKSIEDIKGWHGESFVVTSLNLIASAPIERAEDEASNPTDHGARSAPVHPVVGQTESRETFPDRLKGG